MNSGHGLSDGYRVYHAEGGAGSSRSLGLQTQEDWQKNASTLEGTWEQQASGDGGQRFSHLFPLRHLSSFNYLPPGRLLSTISFSGKVRQQGLHPRHRRPSPRTSGSQLRGEIYHSSSSQRKMSSLVTRVAFCPSFSAPNAERSGRLVCKCHRSQ